MSDTSRGGDGGRVPYDARLRDGGRGRDARAFADDRQARRQDWRGYDGGARYGGARVLSGSNATPVSPRVSGESHQVDRMLSDAMRRMEELSATVASLSRGSKSEGPAAANAAPAQGK